MPACVLLIELGGRGGVADYTSRLARDLAAAGVDVRLATAADHAFQPAPGVTILPVFHYLRETSRWRRALRRARVHKAWHAVDQLVGHLRLIPEARRCGVVHLQGGYVPPLTVINLLVLRAAGARIVHTPHNTFERGRSFARARGMQAAIAARTIVHTQADLREVQAAHRASTVVIPHAHYGWLADTAAPADRAATRAELGIPQDAPAVVCFGQLRADKGLDDVMAAAREVPGLHVIVAGSDDGGAGPVRDALGDPTLAGRVHLREGFQSIDDTARWFAAADAAVFAYRVASASGALLLGYGFRRPAVVYPVGGLPEAVVDGETGWICERGDVPSLTAALAAVVAAGSQRCAAMGEAARAYADREFSAEVVARRTAETYAAVRGTAPSGHP